MERQGEDYRRRLREGFLHEAARQPQTIAVIDGSRSIDEVQADIRRESGLQAPMQ
jgi:thymidylate kinase